MTTLQELFVKGFELGQDIQRREHANEEVNGRAEWGAFEKTIGELKDEILTDDDANELEYNSSLDDIYDKMDKIIDKFGMDKSEFCPKSNHFFMQLKNLVKAKSNFKIQVNRVMQLGLNAGQLNIFIERGTLCDDRRKLIEEIINKNNMFNLDTYVSKKNQEIINKKYLASIATMEGGGTNNYHKKYLKYKAKYLKLKTYL